MKRIKLLLSAVILVAISIGVAILGQYSNAKINPSIAYFILGWVAASIVGVFVFIFRFSGFINNKESFGYIFLGSANFFIGAFGLSEILFRGIKDHYLPAVLLFGTMMLGVFFLWDIFFKNRSRLNPE